MFVVYLRSCTICMINYLPLSKWIEHFISHHTVSTGIFTSTHNCCGLTFSNLVQLMLHHMEKHSNDRMECSYCEGTLCHDDPSFIAKHVCLVCHRCGEPVHCFCMSDDEIAEWEAANYRMLNGHLE